MSLRRKTSIVIGVCLVILTLIMYSGLKQVLVNNLLIQENENVREDMIRAINAFDNEKRELQGLTSDWAQWDDAYNYIGDGNNDFIDSNMVDSTFTNLKVNLILFSDNSGRIVYAKAFDLTKNTEAQVPASLNHELKKPFFLIQDDKSRTPITGILMLPETPVLISSAPILRSDGSGSVNGTLLLGRYIDAAHVKRLSEITNLDLDLLNISNIGVYPDFETAYLSIDEANPLYIRPENNQIAVGYTILNDLYGNPSLVVKIQVPRGLYQQGMSIIMSAGIVVIIEGALIGILVLLLMERLVLSRLSRLNREVIDIGKAGFGSRVTNDGSDELGQLAGAINNMLAGLEKSNLENTRILESISDSFVSYDEDLRYTYVNKAAEQMLGFHREDLIGQKADQVYPEMDNDFRDKYRQVLGEKTPQHIEVYLDFLQRWLEMNIYPKEKGISVYFRDISERKQREDTALRQSEELFFQAFHRNPIMMAIFSTEEDRFIDANEVLLTTLGYTRDEIIDHKVFDMDLFKNLEKVEMYKQILMENGKLENIRINFFTKSGDARRGLLWSYLFFSQGKPCHLAAVIDITEHSRIQDEFERLDRLNLVGQIAASIAHEIRNPMTTVRGLLQIMNEQEELAKNHSYFDLMIEELDRANTIISEFLSIAQNKAVDLKSECLDSIIRTLYPLIQADANYSGTQVKLELCNPPKLLLDEGEIRQLILNLARNGLDAMPSGGLLTIGTRVQDNEIVLFIKDEGGGLDPSVKDKLGTPFLTTKDNGTGLGLAICYSIAAHHDARIEVDTGDKGTTFLVHFSKG